MLGGRRAMEFQPVDGIDGFRVDASANPLSIDPSEFAVGSMRPKLEAAIGFTNETGNKAHIGRLDQAIEILAGHAGTCISCA